MLKQRYEKFFPLDETCPEGSQPRSGKCARADNNGYLRNVCDRGFHWDRINDRCIPLAKEEVVK